MDGPFFTNHRRYQQPHSYRRPFHPSPSVRGVPVYSADRSAESHRPSEMTSAPKVVRVPVHFVGSEKVDRLGSAVRIQKIFRGFLVRKNLRKIKDIKLQVEEIEERLKRREIVSLVKTDAKERLRMNESLMALLLKLDSICGVDLGVRGRRKDVIRKAIALQERIDAIVAADLDKEEEGGEIDVESEVRVSSENEETENPAPSLDRDCPSSVDDGAMDMEGGNGDEAVDIVDVGVDREASGDANNLDFVAEGSEIVKGGAGDGRTEREMLEKMMVVQNEKMMSMMTRLFERSESQTAMLNALSRRVELLEKAYMCDRLRKKQQRKAKSAATCK